MIVQLSYLVCFFISSALLSMEETRISLGSTGPAIESIQEKYAPLYNIIKAQLAELRPNFDRSGPVYPQEYKISRQKFIEVLRDATVLSYWLMVRSNDSWLYDAKPNFSTIDERLDKEIMFQQRHITEPIKLVCQGDIHGDAHSFINLISYWQELGYIEKNSLRFIRPELRFCFHGDLVDRGCFGAYVYMLIGLLKIANPTQVFCVRGNHEDLNIHAVYGFNKELYHLFGSSHKEVQPVIHAFNNTMPFALYIGLLDSPDSRHLKYIRCNHGGISIGFLPDRLLAADRCKEYELITALDIPLWNSCIAEHINTSYPGYEKDKKELEHTLGNKGQLIPVENLQQFHDAWGDFVLSKKEYRDLEPSARGQDFFPSVGYETTIAFLKACSSESGKKEAEYSSEVYAICRAHQHTRESLPLILHNPRDHQENHGMLRLWLEPEDERSKEGEQGKIQKNMVYTFLVCPNTTYSTASNRLTENIIGVLDLQSPLENSTVKIVKIPTIWDALPINSARNKSGTSN